MAIGYSLSESGELSRFWNCWSDGHNSCKPADQGRSFKRATEHRTGCLHGKTFENQIGPALDQLRRVPDCRRLSTAATAPQSPRNMPTASQAVCNFGFSSAKKGHRVPCLGTKKNYKSGRNSLRNHVTSSFELRWPHQKSFDLFRYIFNEIALTITATQQPERENTEFSTIFFKFH